jgi:uncharacterized protein (DUF58 family)
MDRESLLAKIKRLRIPAARLAKGMMSGAYRSAYKGRGMEFEELRPYSSDDDASLIDWAASARARSPYVKRFREERELSHLIVLDASASMFAGGRGEERYSHAAVTAALIAYAAAINRDKVGALIFSGGEAAIIPVKAGSAHAQALVDRVISVQDHGGGSDLGEALAKAALLLKRGGICYVASDFKAEAWDGPLRELARRCTVIALHVKDPLDEDFPRVGLIELRDPETGRALEAAGMFRSFRSAYAGTFKAREAEAKRAAREAGASWIELRTTEDPVEALVERFSRTRK